jgi:hypothetical protein
MGLRLVLQRLEYGHITVHGFRSVMRDWAGDTTQYPRDLCEAALAHAAGDTTETAYRRGSAIERRRSLMADWCTHCYKVPRRPLMVPAAG